MIVPIMHECTKKARRWYAPQGEKSRMAQIGAGQSGSAPRSVFQAVWVAATLVNPNSSMLCLRISTLRILPVTVIGKLSVNLK